MIPTRDFLNHLFYNAPRGDYLELAYILPPEYDGPSPIVKHLELGRDRIDWDKIEAMNARNYSVFYGLTTKRERPPKRAAEKHTGTITSLWVDLDEDTYPNPEDALNALQSFPLFCTVIVFSGGGCHGLWKIQPIEATPENTKRVKATLHGLAEFLKGDPHCAETARVFRLPGTINTKKKRNGARCEIIDWLPGEWTLDDFAGYAVESRPVERPRFAPPSEPLNLPRWVTDYLEAGAAKGSRNARLYAATIEYRANGYSWGEAARDLIPRAQADGLGDREIDTTMQSAWGSGKGEPNIGRSNNWRGG